MGLNHELNVFNEPFSTVQNLHGLHGHHSVRAGLAEVAHDIAKLLAMAGIRPGWAT
jgi:hypothetical protein